MPWGHLWSISITRIGLQGAKEGNATLEAKKTIDSVRRENVGSGTPVQTVQKERKDCMDLFDSLYNGAIEEPSDVNVLVDTTFRKHFKQLHDFVVKLSHNKLRREHGRITISSENGKFKVTITDPTASKSFSMLCESVEAGLRSMENCADNSAIHWYYWGAKKAPAKNADTNSTAGTGKRSRTKKKVSK